MCVSFSLTCLLLQKVITTSIPVKILAGWHCQGSVTACTMCVGGKFSPLPQHSSTTSNLPKLGIRSLNWLLFSHTYTETCQKRKPFLTSFTASSKAFFTADPSHLLIFTGLSLSWKDSNILSTDDTHITITVSRNVTLFNIRAHWFPTTFYSSIRTSLKHEYNAHPYGNGTSVAKFHATWKKELYIVKVKDSLYVSPDAF